MNTPKLTVSQPRWVIETLASLTTWAAKSMVVWNLKRTRTTLRLGRGLWICFCTQYDAVDHGLCLLGLTRCISLTRIGGAALQLS